MSTNFEKFQSSYTEPTYLEYLKNFLIIPTWNDAHLWSHARMGEGPMTEEEYQGYLTLTSDSRWNKENADSINRDRCRTTVGWYLYLWIRFFTRFFTYSYEDFKEVHYDNAIEEWMDKRDESLYY